MLTAFAGIVYPDALQTADLIEGMFSALNYRSQGNRNIYNFKNFQIGSLGKPPTPNTKKTCYIVIDGWIENREALLLELTSEKPPLSDEETLLLAYEKWGERFLEKIQGEFALMLLDQQKEQLLLARDRIGKIPLYWFQYRGYFLFASDIKALLATGIVPQTPASDALASYLFFGFIPQDMTPIEGITRLLPAHYLLFNANHSKRILQYWSYSYFFTRRTHSHKIEIVSHIHELLRESVSARIPEEGPLGCIISGGLGSATVAYYVSNLAKKRPLEAFTAGFFGQSGEDIEATRSVCEKLMIPQTIGEITPENFFFDFPKVLWHLGEPLADPNIMATWKLAEESSNFTSTVYSGMGSDEVLAGHNRYTLAERNASFNRLMFLPRPIMQHFFIPACQFFYPRAAFNLLKISRINPWQFEYLRSAAIFDEEQLKEASPKLAGFFSPENFLHKFHNLSKIPSNVASFLYFDVKTRLPDAFIFQYERLMRAFGLNWQTPFLDGRIVEYAASLPAPETLKETETASYLKPLVQDIFTTSFINRPKKTRKFFLASWMQYPEFAEIFQLLQKGTLIETGLISERWMRKQLVNIERIESAFPRLFSILALEVWFRLFINRSNFSSPPNITLKELLQE